MRFLSRSSSSRTGVLARAGLLVLAALHLTCNQAILTAPLMSTLQLFANPEFIPANGGVSVISAIVIEPNTGTPVADGTVVQFFTNLGRIQEQAKTNDGVARVNLIADTRSGTATISAFSGAATDTQEVSIGGGIPPSKILLTANPLRLVEQRASSITATVVDAQGNPVPNIAVFFSITAVDIRPPSPAPTGPPTTRPTPIPTPTPAPPERDEFLESRGSPVFTDNNGRATDVMRTNRPLDDIRYVVTVTAELAVGSINQDVMVFVN